MYYRVSMKRMNGKKLDRAAPRRMGPRSTESPDVYQNLLIMNFPYSRLIMEADSAKQQLTRVFQTEAGGHISSLAQSDIKRCSVKNDWNEADNRPKESFNFFRLRDIRSNPWKNTRSAKGLYWMREDMGALTLAWTLVLLSAVAATQTDQPVLWLLIGPAPLALGVVAAGFLRRRFDLCAILRGFRGSYQCHCQWWRPTL
jgi:hypothetical protein